MASWYCDLALAVGLSMSGTCGPTAPTPDPLPTDDPGAWAYQAPVAKPEAPPSVPAPAPNFPPIIIKQEVIREVQVPVVTPAPQAMPAPAEPKPDPMALALAAGYQARRQASDMPKIIAASLPADSGNTLPRAPAMPLDMGAMVNPDGVGSEYKEDGVTSSGPVDNSRVVTTDRYIAGILETGINTQLDGATGGPVVIQTTRDVFGYHGRNILIPKGSRLVCAFKSLSKVGASRAPLRCSRVLTGGARAEIYSTKANVTDVQGQLGVSGDVDNRFWERYGTAFILTGISAAVRAASTSTTTNESLANQSPILSTGGEELSQRLGEITAATLEQTINLNPILKIAQGTRIQIRPDTDWYIAQPQG